MNTQIWSWILTAVGLTGFILAGRKVWWCWYINIACQGLWFTYAIVTKQYGFIAAALVYTIVFGRNAYRWTREHKQKTMLNATEIDSKPEEHPMLCGSQTTGLNGLGGNLNHVHTCMLWLLNHPEGKDELSIIPKHRCECGATWWTRRPLVEQVTWCSEKTYLLTDERRSGHDRPGHMHSCTIINGRHPKTLRLGVPVIEHWCECGGSWQTVVDET